jgi:GTP cyclohydrolase II
MTTSFIIHYPRKQQSATGFVATCPRCRFYVQVDWICKHWPTHGDQSAVGFSLRGVILLGAQISQYPRQSRGLDYVSRSKRLERGR